MDTESHPRPRRTRHDSTKHYDRERKDLELSEVLDVLQRYVDYGGGINCCVCGKLYKSRVCFIKHLWEHTIYWDLFAGDKNHMRVLSIQAALILYGSCQQPLCPVPVDNLLVTSPHSTDSGAEAKPPSTGLSSPSVASPTGVTSVSQQKVSSTRTKEMSGVLSARDAAKLLPTTPVKQIVLTKVPSAPRKKMTTGVKATLKRKAPPKLDLGTPEKLRCPVIPQYPTSNPDLDRSTSPVMTRTADPVCHTPIKQKIPFVVPQTPKKVRRSAESNSKARRHRQIRPFLLPTKRDVSEGQYWKETDSCACKRKRSE